MTPREFAARAAHLSDASEVVRSLTRTLNRDELTAQTAAETAALVAAAFDLSRDIVALRRAYDAIHDRRSRDEKPGDWMKDG